jgi:hypothetical protein
VKNENEKVGKNLADGEVHLIVIRGEMELEFVQKKI